MDLTGTLENSVGYFLSLKTRAFITKQLMTYASNLFLEASDMEILCSISDLFYWLTILKQFILPNISCKFGLSQLNSLFSSQILENSLCSVSWDKTLYILTLAPSHLQSLQKLCFLATFSKMLITSWIQLKCLTSISSSLHVDLSTVTNYYTALLFYKRWLIFYHKCCFPNWCWDAVSPFARPEGWIAPFCSSQNDNSFTCYQVLPAAPSTLLSMLQHDVLWLQNNDMGACVFIYSVSIF